jgi:hypothetical protein
MLESKGSPRLVLSLLGFSTLVVLGARLGGLQARLPHPCDPDRYIVAEAAWFDRPASMVPGSFEAYPQTMYPGLLSRLLDRLPGRSFAPTLPVQSSLAEHLAAASAPFVRGRLMIEILSLLAIPCFRIHTVLAREMLADRRIGSDEVRTFLESEQPAYVIVALGGDPAVGWETLRQVLREEGHELAAQFTAWKPSSEDLIDVRFEEGDRGLAKVLAAERPGPDLEIYRMDDPGSGR